MFKLHWKKTNAIDKLVSKVKEPVVIFQFPKYHLPSYKKNCTLNQTNHDVLDKLC